MSETTERRFDVVLNDEEQYSIWPIDRDVPAGWHAEGTSGTQDECIAHIEPRSLRR